MSKSRAVKDVMVDVFDFPHIPYWFTMRQAVGIVKKSLLSGEKCHHPLAVLVFDEKYNLLGTLSLKDILRGLEPKFMRTPTDKAQVLEENEAALSLIWDTLFDMKSKELAEKPVSEAMIPAKFFVEPGDPITKAAYLMIHHDLALLPVLEGKKKFVGIVRMVEIFTELSKVVLD